MSAVAFKIVQVKRPVSGQVIGYRMVLAHINEAAFVPCPEGGGYYAQSFAPKYRITESGDMHLGALTPEKQRSFIERAMKWHRFDRLEIY